MEKKNKSHESAAQKKVLINVVLVWFNISFCLFGMWLKVFLFLILYISTLSIDIANGVAWPQCGEFVFPKDDTDNKLSIEEKQFKRKLPTLFESYDCGNALDVEKTLKSLEKFKNLTSPSSEKKCSETQTLSPSLEIVSGLHCKPLFVSNFSPI